MTLPRVKETGSLLDLNTIGIPFKGTIQNAVRLPKPYDGELFFVDCYTLTEVVTSFPFDHEEIPAPHIFILKLKKKRGEPQEYRINIAISEHQNQTHPIVRDHNPLNLR